MDGRRRAKMSRLLDEREADARSRVAAVIVATDELAGARGDSTADDEHDPEGVTLSAEWSRLTGLQSEAEAELMQIAAARDRLVDGSYGVCVDCGQDIPIERLEIRPFADRCVACAERQR